MRADEFVVVAVDQRVDVVAEDAARDVVEFAPVKEAVVEGLGRLQRAGLEVENQDVVAHGLLVARVSRQGERGQVEVLADEGEAGLGGGDLERLVELADDVVDAELGSAFAGDGPAGRGLVSTQGVWAGAQGGEDTHLDVGGALGQPGHVRRALPGQEAEDEDQHEAGGDGKAKQGPPRTGRGQHRVGEATGGGRGTVGGGR